MQARKDLVLGFWTSIVADLRYAFRLLTRAPLLSATSILSLTIGIAGTTAIFTLADAILLRETPGIRNSAELADLYRTTNGEGYGTLSYPLFEYLRDRQSGSLSGMAATSTEPRPVSLTQDAGSEQVFVRSVSGSYFDVLQTRPALGRFFHTDEDELPGGRPVVVMSHRFWQSRFQADPEIIGQSMRLNRTNYTVIGVAEAGFDGESILAADFWVPLAMVGSIRGAGAAQLLRNPDAYWHRGIVRLMPDVARAAAEAELNALLQEFRTLHPTLPDSYGIGLAENSRLPVPVRAPFAAFLALLFFLTAGLLGIACSNVAATLLARAAVRGPEIATRLALGAGRARLVVQLLVETVVLFTIAGTVALPLTVWLLGMLKASHASLPLRLPLLLDLPVTGRTLLFALGISIVTALVFGMAPARYLLRSDLSQALTMRSFTVGRSRHRFRHVLVSAQVAISLALIMTAGLFLRTLQQATAINPGFETANRQVVSIDTSLVGAQGTQASDLIDLLMARLSSVGGVTDVAVGRMGPLQGGGFALGSIQVPGLPEVDSARLGEAHWDLVSGSYFQTLDMPILEGRAFDAQDRPDGPKVAVVNQTLAELAWPGRSAVGQTFFRTRGVREDAVDYQVIGVVQNASYQTIGEAPQFFVKHQPERSSLGPDIRATIREIEPSLPVLHIQPLEEAALLGLFPQRLAAWIAGSVGAIGIFLAALGVYGLVAFLVAQRGREIAIRMAIGASRQDVRKMVLIQAARLGLTGSAAGFFLALALGKLIQGLGLLIGIQPTDPLTIAVPTILMLATLFLASYFPAQRAAMSDPALALRN